MIQLVGIHLLISEGVASHSWVIVLIWVWHGETHGNCCMRFNSSWNSKWHKRKRRLLISATSATVQTKGKAGMPGHILAFSKLWVQVTQVRNQSIYFSRCSFYMPDSFSINGKNKSPNNFKESQEILHMQLFIEIFVYIASLFPQGKGSMRKRRQKDC